MKRIGTIMLGSVLLGLLLGAPAVDGEEKKPAEKAEEGFVPLFNGKDLSGWVKVNNAPGTYFVKDNEIVTTGIPTGFMRTEKQYENFILEMEWKHIVPKGNSGLFVWADALPAVGTPFARAIEVQILDGLETKNYTSDGDIFSIWGATLTPDRPHPSGWARCLPSEKRSKPAGQWNHYRVEAIDGVIKLAVNGKVVSGGSKCSPRKGYLALEAEGSECHFRNLKIKELPSTDPKPDETANVGQGFETLFTGLNFDGWKVQPEQKELWKVLPGPNKLAYTGKGVAKGGPLFTQASYGDFELVCDWRLSNKPVKTTHTVKGPDGQEKKVEVDDAGDSGILLRGSKKSMVRITCGPEGSGEIQGYREDEKQPEAIRKAVTPKLKADGVPGKWNRFVITMKGEEVSVKLNGKIVIEKAQLPGVAANGPIGLRQEAPVEFGNLFIRELK